MENTLRNFNIFDEWQCWIDLNDRDSDECTLYVRGELFWLEPVIKPALVKRNFVNDQNGQLHLEIRPGIFWKEGQITQLRYSEMLVSANQYQEVLIYAQDKLLVHLRNIKKDL